ncbi:MAG: hypothetical protein OEW30_13820 [Acidimicrobiia bacterium]|nr:hypothetical protein [Acidimicrobiia bacterium]
MTGLVLHGPFLTRAEAAARLGAATDTLPNRAELLRIGGPLQEVYFAFQLRNDAVGNDLARVVLTMRGNLTDQEIADWLFTENPLLDGATPLRWLENRRSLATLLGAARREGGRLTAGRELAGPATRPTPNPDHRS